MNPVDHVNLMWFLQHNRKAKSRFSDEYAENGPDVLNTLSPCRLRDCYTIYRIRYIIQ